MPKIAKVCLSRITEQLWNVGLSLLYILYYIILYYIILYYIILYYIVLYCIVLYCIMLYCIVLYYIILCYIKYIIGWMILLDPSDIHWYTFPIFSVQFETAMVCLHLSGRWKWPPFRLECWTFFATLDGPRSQQCSKMQGAMRVGASWRILALVLVVLVILVWIHNMFALCVFFCRLQCEGQEWHS